MEGSYDPVFHQSGSSTPMTPNAPSGPASQYKANVNRTKTRKWVEAKTVDYGGDDWGGDYDDEPEEPEPEPQPQPLARPQGPRTSASFSNSQPPSPAGPRPLQTGGLRAASPAISSSPGLRTPVGATPLHIQTQQQSANQPGPVDTGSPWRQGPPSRGSTPGLDRPREISPHAVGVPQSATASSVYSAVSEFGQMFDRGASPPAQGPFQGQRPRVRSPGPQSASGSAPTRFAPRKSSLGQHDAPADSPYSPIHQDSERQMGSRPGSRQANQGGIMSPNKPWMVEGTVGGPRSASPSGSMRSSITSGKPLPFVRPADIYKKLEDEKEKVRRSIDSGRPSMDSLGFGRGSEATGSLRTQSPAGASQNSRQAQEQGQVRPDSDVISPGLARVVDVPVEEKGEVDEKGRKGTAPGRDDDDSIVPRGPRTGLPTVAERKSEYGIEGLIASYEARGGISDGNSQEDASPLARGGEQTSVPSSRDTEVAVPSSISRLKESSEVGEDRGQQVHKASETANLDKKEGAGRQEDSGSAHLRHEDAKAPRQVAGAEEANQVQSGEELRRLSTSPKLPELGRLSVFGFDLFSSSASSNPQTSSSFNKNPTSSPPASDPPIPSSHTIVSHSSPLSTVIESPSSASSLPGIQDAEAEARPPQGQRQEEGEPTQRAFGQLSGTQLPAPSHSLSQPHDSSASPSTRLQSGERQDQHRLSHSSSSDSEPNSDTASRGEQDTAEQVADHSTDHSVQRSEPESKDLSNLHSGSNPTVTSKSESEHQPSIDKALPALPSEVSMVTPDTQPSQLVISSPIPIVGSGKNSPEGDDGPLSTDPKLKLHPLLRRESEKIHSIPPQVSSNSGSHATSTSAAQASELTPADDHVLPPPNLPGPLITDYQSYLPSTSSENNTMASTLSASNNTTDYGVFWSTTLKNQVGQDVVVGDEADNTTLHPPHPSIAPPAPPGKMSRGETYVTARESLESPSTPVDNASPSKSDKLSAEILRSLSQAPSTGTPSGQLSNTARPSSIVPGDGARESSYLPELYDDYWNLEATGNAADSSPAPGITPNTGADVMPAALNVSSDDRPKTPVRDTTRIETLPKTPVRGNSGRNEPLPKTPVRGENAHNSLPPVTQAVTTPRSSVDIYKTDAQAVTVELHRPVLANRFSWERDGPEAAKVDIKPEPKSLSEKPQPSTTANTPVVEKTPGITLADVKSGEPTATSSKAPSPARAFEGKSKDAAAQSRASTPTATIQPSTTFVPSTLSEDVPMNENMARRLSGAHSGPLTSNPVMTFREIMEMPTQQERITEFNKARNHYAAADSGLETILEHFAVQHPDVVENSRTGAPASQIYTHDFPSAQDAGGLLSPTTAVGTAPPSTRHHSLPTGHIGAKTKEFFGTAGKASKGLFSTLKAKGKKDSVIPESASLMQHAHDDAHVGAASSDPAVSNGSTRPRSKRTNSWTASSISIQDNFLSFSNAVKRELKERRTSLQLPAARPAPGSRSSQLSEQQHQAPNDNSTIDNVGKIDNYELDRLDQSAVPQNSSARRGRFSLSGLIIRTGAHQARQPAPGPLLASLVGVRQQQEQGRDPSQLNVTGHPRPTLVVSSSSSQPPQLPKPTRLSPFGLLSPSSPWPPPVASDATPELPPLPAQTNSLIGNDNNDPGANSHLILPVSETYSLSQRPTPIAKDQRQQQLDNRPLSLVSLDSADKLRVPAPISKFQPTWDPYTGTPLFEEEGFDFHDPSSHEPAPPGPQALSIASVNTDDNRDGPSPDRNVVSPVTVDEQHSGDIDHEAVLDPGATTKTSERTDSDNRSHGAQRQTRERRKDKEPQAEEAGMAAYAQQQQQQPQLQQQYNHPGYQSSPPLANNYGGQPGQSQASNSGWQQAPARTSNEAWERSQMYDYQPLQVQGQSHHPQQPPVQQYQYAQQQQQGQPDDNPPHRQSSFVGLPPIRRTSTLLGSVVKVGEDDNSSVASSQHGAATNNSLAMAQPQFASQVQVQHPLGTPQQYQITGGYRPSQPASPNQLAYANNQGIPPQSLQGSPQPQQQYFPPGSPGLQGRAFSGPQALAVPNGDPRFAGQEQGQSSTPHLIPQVLRQNAGAVSPNAGGPIRLPPQGAWKLEESHLQQPLMPSRGRSPSNATTPTDQPFYGFDKETGLPINSPSPSQQPPQSPVAAQAGKQHAPNAQAQPQPGQVPRSDTADTTNTTDLSPPRPIEHVDDKQSRRNSGLFSNIRGRFSREGPEDRRESASGPSGLAASYAPTSDAISESSVATEELQERRKRHSFFGGHGLSHLSQQASQTQQPAPAGPSAASPPTNALPNNGERPNGQGPPTAFDQITRQNTQQQQQQPYQQPQQFPPLEKKKTFFGLPAGPGRDQQPQQQQQQQPVRPNMSRASTSSNTITPADASPPPPGGGGPKKRFSGLTSKMFSRSSGNNHQNGERPPGSSHSARPSFSQGVPPGAPQQQQQQSFSGGFNGGFQGHVQGQLQGQQGGQFARPPGAPPGPGSPFGQQGQQQQQQQLGAGQGFIPTQQLVQRQGVPQQGPQQGPHQGLQQGQQLGQAQQLGQQSPPQQQQQQRSPQQQQQQFQPGQQAQQGQQQAPQFGQQRPVEQHSPNPASAQSPGSASQSDGQKTPQAQQNAFPGQPQQQQQQLQQGQQFGPQPGQQPVQQQPGQQQPGQQQPGQQQPGQQQPGQPQPGQQQPGQQSPPQQQQQFQQRLAQQTGQPSGFRQPGQQLPSQQQQSFPQQRPIQQQPSQQSLSQQQQPFQQQRLGQQQSGPQQQGLMGPPPPIGRGRSDSMGSRPFTPGDSRPNPMMTPSQSYINEEHRGRKPSGGGFLSSLFGGRSGSKTREPRQGPQGQPQAQQAMMTPAGGQQQQFGQSPGQQPSQYILGQQGQRIPSPLAQQQHQGPRPLGPSGQYGPPQPGQQQPFVPAGAQGQQQFAHQRQVSGQQRPLGPGQQPPQNMIPQGSPAPQQDQVQGNGPRPMLYPQLQSQQSQASIASATPGQQQPALANGQRTPSGQPFRNTPQGQSRETPPQRTSPGPLNQHPPMQVSPPPQDMLRAETVSPPVDDSASNIGPPGSPPLQSPISQVSTSVPFTPVDRQSNDSPMSFRQTAPPQQQQQQAGQTDPPRQSFQGLARGPSTQSPARKPLQSAPRPGQASQASSIHGGSVHGGSDHSKGSPSISSVHLATATASPIDHSRRPSQQLSQQISLQQTNSPLAQPPQLANQPQPFQKIPLPGQQTPPGQLGPNAQAGFPGQAPQQAPQQGQAPGGPSGQTQQNQQGMRPFGQQQQQPGQAGSPAPGQQGQQGQPYAGSQRPWAVSTSGPVPHQGQAGPFFQAQQPHNASSEKEPKGTISKFLNKAKELTKEVTSSNVSQDKPEKEKGGKSRFGFLRSSYQPEQRQQQPPPLQGGPQFQGPPGRPVMPQESQIERLQQLQSQVSPSEAQPQPRPSPTPSPGPHLNYQHQRQSPNGTSPQVQPTAGSKTPSPGTQQALSPVQGSPSGPQQQQQQIPSPAQQQGAPRPQQGQPGQGPPPGSQNRAGFPGFGQTPKPPNQRPAPAQVQRSNEPQYGQVPIPTGYGKVHSEGRVEPAPVAYYMGPHGQFLPVQSGTPGSQPQVQPWIQPGTQQRHPSYGATQQQAQYPGQPQPLHTQQPITRVALVSPNAATPGFPAGGTHPHVTDPGHPLTVQNPDQQARSLVHTPQVETPQPAFTPSIASPAPDAQVQGYPTPAHETPSRPEPERFQTAMSNPSGPTSPPPQLQHPGSPQSYPLPDTIFSPVNPDAEHAPTPPLPTTLPSPLPNSDLVPSPLRPQSTLLQMAVPQRQVSAVSQVSSLQPDHHNSTTTTTNQAPSTAAGAHFAVDSGYLQARSPSPQAVHPGGYISPEPPAAVQPPRMHIDVQQANENGGVEEEQDNIYDATPRTETSPVQHLAQRPVEHAVHQVDHPAENPAEHHTEHQVQQLVQEHVIPSPAQEEPAEPKAGGTGHEVLEHRDQQPQQQQQQQQLPQNLVINTQATPSPSPPPVIQPAPTHQAVAEPSTTTTTTTTNGTSPTPPPAASRTTPPAAAAAAAVSNNPIDIFEEAKRKAVLRDMEEKIPVFPTEPDMALDSRARAEMAARKKAEEERPQMSATSYPGQEWNPYGDGWVDEE